MDKFVFFDIDGTTVDTFHNRKTMYPSTKMAIAAAQQSGVRAFVATGRTINFIIEDVREYPFDGFIACNGAYVEYNGRTVFKQKMSIEALQAVKKVADELQIPFVFEGRDFNYVSDLQDMRLIKFADLWGMRPETMIQMDDLTKIEVYMSMIFLDDNGQEMAMREALEPFFTIVRHPGQMSFDLTQKGISKAVGISRLLEDLSVSIQDVYAFGDAGNDIEMLKAVGTGICMGNGVEEAKEAADYVTDAVWEDGIPNALIHFDLIKPQYWQNKGRI